MTRTILVHLNVTVDDNDPRDTDEIVRVVMDAIDVGSDAATFDALTVTMALAEQID